MRLENATPYAARLLQIGRADLGQADMSARPIEQSHRQAPFQHRDMLADRRMRHVEAIGCCGETTQLCHRAEDPHAQKCIH